MAVGKASATISGTKISANSWNIVVKISDKYDFDEWRNMNSFGSIANNIGFLMQNIGYLTPYDWDVTFSFIYQED